MKLGLGTVQFGIDYGISNQVGKTSLEEAKNILQIAQRSGLTVIDTAYSYCNSEVVIGQVVASQHPFRIITKTPIFQKEKININDAERLKNTFYNSLKQLKQPKISGLLIHHVDDLLTEGGELLFYAMQELKQEKLIEKIGTSIYTKEQIDSILAKYVIDLIQLPVNVLDQRLIESGHLTKLKENNVEIHARSVFLQGLLLMDPESLHPFFDSVKPMLHTYKQFLQSRHLTPVEGALSFIEAITEIDYAIIGVNSAGQLKANLECVGSLRHDLFLDDFKRFSIHDSTYLNPSLWNLE